MRLYQWICQDKARVEVYLPTGNDPLVAELTLRKEGKVEKHTLPLRYAPIDIHAYETVALRRFDERRLERKVALLFGNL